LISTDEARRLTERFEASQGQRNVNDLQAEFWERFLPGGQVTYKKAGYER
jgi:hypothetical protein